MTESYDAILFDMDGVLLEGPATPAAVYQAGADRVIDGLDVSVTEDQRRTLGKYGYDDQLAACCRDLGVDQAQFWTARERAASTIANERIRDGAREPYRDTTVLDNLRGELGIVSNNRDATVSFVAKTLFDGRFDVATGREETVAGYRRRKPDSHYIETTLETLDAEHAVYVGDRESDIVAATRAGIDSAFLRREHNSQMTLDTAPTYDIDGLSELPTVLSDGE